MRLLAGTMLGAIAGVTAGAAAAQDAQPSLPDLGNYSLPSGQQVPVPLATPTPAVPLVVPPRPTPTPTPTPRANPTPAVRPSATPTPRAATSPAPRTTPTPAPTASPTPVPEASPTPAPTIAAPSSVPGDGAPAPEIAAPAAAEASPARPAWLWPLLIGLLVLGGAAFVISRRRRNALERLPAPAAVPLSPTPEPDVAPPTGTDGASAAAPVAPAAPRFLEPVVPVAEIHIDEPMVRRAGLNMVTATADVVVAVRNVSGVPARGVSLDIRLTSAQPGQDAAVSALFTQPSGRPAMPPFDMAPGEVREIRTLATMPRDAITVLQAGGRPMFVPVIAIRAAHPGGETISVHALGIERPGQAKLGPFWLDQPSRMFDTIGVRPHNGRW